MFSIILKNAKFQSIAGNGLRNFALTSSQNRKKKEIALVLSGCGVYDGSEIIEASSAIIHLSRHNANISFFAPNIPQLHVINHLTGEVLPESRNVLQESARIARGKIESLDKLKTANFEALVFPGGFGAAKNLSTFAIDGAHFKVEKEVERVVKEFVSASKPIGFCCIAPVIAARVIPECELTVGKSDAKSGVWPYAGTVDALSSIGAEMVEKDVEEIHVDAKFKIVTTPAFMKEATFYQVFNGIGEMIDEVIKLTE